VIKNRSLLTLILLIFYELCYFLLIPVLLLLSKTSKKLTKQLRQRSVTQQQITKIEDIRSRYQKSVVFHCSSAGEYEQVKPLVDNLLQEGSVYVHIFFLSYSGLDFASIKDEKASISICPHDFRRNWDKILSAAQPDLAIVVRYELWPGFLYTAQEHSPLWLINYNKNSNSNLSKLVQKPLLRFFSKIYTLNQVPENNPKYVHSGDTKFDRAYYNFANRQTVDSQLRVDFSGYTRRKTLIGGSVWLEDVKVIFAAYNLLSKPEKKQTNIILVPHDLSEENIQNLTIESVKAGIPVQVYLDEGQKINQATQVIIVNMMGKLAEIYSYGTLAFVGGAFHHKVHNILEPATFNLPIAFGPSYQSQAEAEQLIGEKLAISVTNSTELSKWWINNLEKDKTGPNNEESNLKRFSGSSIRIQSDIQELLCKQK